ncbi:MAG TPA: hypothetical protein VIJ76_02230 [Galbitalea sp.]
MNTVLSTQVDHQHHHPPSSQDRVTRARRVSLADRVALHVGLALVTWSRRPGAVAERPGERELARAGSIERANREWQAERALRLTLPPR